MVQSFPLVEIVMVTTNGNIHLLRDVLYIPYAG